MHDKRCFTVHDKRCFTVDDIFARTCVYHKLCFPPPPPPLSTYTSSHSVKNCVKNSPLHTVPQQVISNSVFFLPTSLQHSRSHPHHILSVSPSVRACMCVCVCVCVSGGGGRCEEYSIMFMRLYYVHMLLILLRGVLTTVSEIARYGNGHCYHC